MPTDALVNLFSNATISASTNGAAYNFLTTPGGPIRGWTFECDPGTWVNTTIAGTATFTIQESNDTAFTNVTNTHILFQESKVVTASATTTPNAFALPVQSKQSYVRAIVVPPAGVTMTGLYIRLGCGRRV